MRILKVEEEHSIVELIKNKKRCHQGISRKQATNLIIDILKIRDYCKTKNQGGHKFLKLSDNAKHAVKTGK